MLAPYLQPVMYGLVVHPHQAVTQHLTARGTFKHLTTLYMN